MIDSPSSKATKFLDAYPAINELIKIQMYPNWLIPQFLTDIFSCKEKRIPLFNRLK